MINADAIKWLENLKKNIGNPAHQSLWHYEQALTEIIDLLADRKTENSSEKPNNCEKDCFLYRSTTSVEDEPQTDTEIAKAIVHKMIDDAVIAEDAYPDLRQKMHDAVDEYEPQTECDKHCMQTEVGCESTDCAWRKGE